MKDLKTLGPCFFVVEQLCGFGSFTKAAVSEISFPKLSCCNVLQCFAPRSGTKNHSKYCTYSKNYSKYCTYSKNHIPLNILTGLYAVLFSRLGWVRLGGTMAYYILHSSMFWGLLINTMSGLPFQMFLPFASWDNQLKRKKPIKYNNQPTRLHAKISMLHFDFVYISLQWVSSNGCLPPLWYLYW